MSEIYSVLPAWQMHPGQMFLLYGKRCTVVESRVNDFDKIVLDFLIESDTSPDPVNLLVVPKTFKIQVYTPV